MTTTLDTTPTPAPRDDLGQSLVAGSLSATVHYSILGGSAIFALLMATVAAGNNPLSINLVLALAIGAVTYTLAIGVASARVEGPRFAADRVVTAVVSSFFLMALLPLISVTFEVIMRGRHRFDVAFFTETMKTTFAEGGGAQHAIVGTLITTAIATVISVPVGLMTSIYLVEYGNKGPFSRVLTFFVDVMTGIPSIVAGLFAASVFTIIVDSGYRSALAGGVALSVIMIPIVVRSSEEMLRLVPRELRESSYALGVPKWLTILKIVVPTAIAGIATGVTLSIARVMGETAPLLVTIGFTRVLTLEMFDSQMATLPTFAYAAYSASTEQYDQNRAWAAALVLIVLVMLLNLIARLISSLFAPKTGR